MQSWLFATDMRENDYGQIPLFENSMSYNYVLCVPVLANSAPPAELRPIRQRPGFQPPKHLEWRPLCSRTSDKMPHTANIAACITLVLRLIDYRFYLHDKRPAKNKLQAVTYHLFDTSEQWLTESASRLAAAAFGGELWHSARLISAE